MLKAALFKKCGRLALLAVPFLIGTSSARAEEKVVAAVSESAVDSSSSKAGRKTRLQGSASMNGALADEDYQQSRVVGLGLDFKLNHLLTRDLEARIDTGAVLQTGSSQTFFSDEHKPYRGLNLTEVSVGWRPLNDGELRFGALSQSWLESDLLVGGGKTFPAARQNWKSRWDSLFVEISAEQAIPTSDSSKSMPRGNDPLPTADFERITFGYEVPEQSLVRIHVGHFGFQNLTTDVAHESRFRGNTVVGTGSEAARYAYGFDGIEAGARAETRLSSRMSGRADAAWLTNLKAPLEKSRGMQLALGASYRVNSDMILSPGMRWFRNESDSTPGYYNSLRVAHNNRQGIGADLKLALPQNRLELEGSYVRGNLIETTPFQSAFTGVSFSLRKSYDLL